MFQVQKKIHIYIYIYIYTVYMYIYIYIQSIKLLRLNSVFLVLDAPGGVFAVS